MKRILVLATVIFIALSIMSAVTAEATGPGDKGADVTQVQAALTWNGWPVNIDGTYGPRTTRTVIAFQKANGLVADGIVGPQTLTALGLATATAPAVRLNPPPPPPVQYTGPCAQYVEALTYFNPGWNIPRMQQIMYRESNCVPTAANSCCTGLLQIHASWIDNAAVCGVYSRADLKDPAKNICAAAVVFRLQGMGAWAT